MSILVLDQIDAPDRAEVKVEYVHVGRKVFRCAETSDLLDIIHRSVESTPVGCSCGYEIQ